MAGLVRVEPDPDLGLRLTHLPRARAGAVITVFDMVSRKGVESPTMCSPQGATAQVKACFLAALEAEGLLPTAEAPGPGGCARRCSR